MEGTNWWKATIWGGDDLNSQTTTRQSEQPGLSANDAIELVTWVVNTTATSIILNWWNDVSEMQPSESEEDLDDLLTKKLEALEQELCKAIEIFENLLWDKYFAIEGTIADIQYWLIPYLDKWATVDNIEATTVFSMIHEYDREGQLAFFNWLLEKLKRNSPVIQWYMLWLIEMLRILYINKVSGFTKDSPEDLKYKEDQQIVYETILKKTFNYFSWDDLEWLLDYLKAFFATYKAHVKESDSSHSSIKQFFEEAKKDPKFIKYFSK